MPTGSPSSVKPHGTEIAGKPVTNLDRDGRRLVMDLVSEHLGHGGMCIMAAHQDIEVTGTVRRVQL